MGNDIKEFNEWMKHNIKCDGEGNYGLGDIEAAWQASRIAPNKVIDELVESIDALLNIIPTDGDLINNASNKVERALSRATKYRSE